MDINSIMKQAQKIQKQLEKKQNEFEMTEYIFESHSGTIKIKILGSKQITLLKINEALIDKNEKEMLEDMLLVAFNEATKSISDERTKILESASNNIGLPEIF